MQRHEFITTYDGESHLVWNYVCDGDPIHPKPCSFEYYTAAQNCVEKLHDEWIKISNESFQNYLKRKKVEYDIISYFD